MTSGKTPSSVHALHTVTKGDCGAGVVESVKH